MDPFGLSAEDKTKGTSQSAIIPEVGCSDDENGFWDGLWNFTKEYIDTVVQTAATSIMVRFLGKGTTAMILVLHYGRNIFNEATYVDYSNYSEAQMNAAGYIKYSKIKSKFHNNNTIGAESNIKYVEKDSWFSSEVILYSNGEVNYTPEDEGTLNVYSGDNKALNIVVHGVFDVVPYMVFGNSPADSTTVVDRIAMIFK